MSHEDFNKLIDKYLAGKASSEEERLIDDFFTAQKHRHTLQHYNLSEEMWSSIEERIHARGVDVQDTVTPDVPHNRIKPRGELRRVLVPLAVAASVAFTVLVVYFFTIPAEQPEVSWITSKTQKGQKSIITLTDGSRVHLNSFSTVSYPASFDQGKREIRLTGEAFFEVVRDEKRPFIVHSGNVTTQVLGTSFNINAYKTEAISVAVATGKVQVNAKHTGTEAKDETSTVVLIPNQAAYYSSVQDRLTMASVDIDKIIAWKNHTLYFDEASLEDVAVQLERWYNVSIEFENDRIKNCSVNGQYKEQSIHDVLGSIRYMHQVDYKFETQTKIILYGKGCSQ